MKINKTFILFILISYYFRGIQSEIQPEKSVKEEHHHHEKIPFGSPEFFMYILYSLSKLKSNSYLCGNDVWFDSGLFFYRSFAFGNSSNEWH